MLNLVTYRDLIIEGIPAETKPNSRPLLPDEYRDVNIAYVPPIPLPDGQYLFYIRANTDVIERIELDTRVNHQIIARSWTELFYSTYHYWDRIFDAEVIDRTDAHSYKVRRKIADIADQEILGIFVPGIFAGDDVPELRAPQFIVERYARFRADTQLVVPTLNAINGLLLERLRVDPHQLFSIDPRKFEELICEILDRHGWRVELTPKTKDGGYDIFAFSGSPGGVSSSWLVECKRYRPDRKVGVEVVRSICGVKEQLKAANAMIVTTSSFTRGAHEWSKTRWDLSLRDYDGILSWLNNVPRST